MTTKRGLLADLERAMNGLAYAHLGEYLPHEDKKAILGVPDARPAGEARSQARRRVALAVQGQVRPGALRYAHNACARMDADLDVLTDLAEGGFHEAMDAQREGLAPTLSESLSEAGHRLEIVRLGRDILKVIVTYARARSGLLFVVVSAEDPFADRVIAGIGDSRGLDVPWVVVAGADSP
jgi:hypothetical protein